MEFKDKILKCIDCGSDFIFTADEQRFSHDKQFKDEPKRCKACKAKRISALADTLASQAPTTRESPDVPDFLPWELEEIKKRGK
jgi:DNA-directed RNA polymerase subunit RPC12/RpoP